IQEHAGGTLEARGPLGRAKNGTLDSLSSDRLDAAVRANVHQTVRQMCAESEAIKQRVAAGGLRVVGATYDLESGAVDFFDDAD
ncbi:MAG: carbonic anhydrase, partial [Planctomycetota bacterium]|nr:carbonic anhydrase [Planctomycetota bacterium]